MKKSLLILVSFLIISFNLAAQKDITLNIIHEFGTDEFVMGQIAVNNLGESFQVNRLEYYISQITLIHDGGIETLIPDTWILVNAGEPTSVDLGNYDITEMEKIEFHIGVEPAVNHEDPAAWANDHPLAPKNPSMHWGWASGYRFVALEGSSGDGMANTFEMHGLGDDNYFKNSIDIQYPTVDENAILIALDANYTKALQDISVYDGAISHGFDGEALAVLENFRDQVFQECASVLPTTDLSPINSFEIYPNPTTERQANLFIDAENDEVYEVVVSDLLGKTIQRIQNVRTNTTLALDLPVAGLHLVSLVKDGQVVNTKKLTAF